MFSKVTPFKHDINRLKIKGWKNNTSISHKKRMTILTSEKVNFSVEKITKDKRESLYNARRINPQRKHYNPKFGKCQTRVTP